MKKLLATIGLIILAAALLLVGWFVYQSLSPTDTTPEEPQTPQEEAAQSAVEQIPELNPIEKTNPFSGSYKNPFKN